MRCILCDEKINSERDIDGYEMEFGFKSLGIYVCSNCACERVNGYISKVYVYDRVYDWRVNPFHIIWDKLSREQLQSIMLSKDVKDMYTKELDFLISTSYGPGRYDNNYEEKGQDYPYGYVRWTENRNMQEYLRLVHSGQIILDKLIEQVFPIERVSDAFESLQQRSHKPLIVVLDYGKFDQKKNESIQSGVIEDISTGDSKIKVLVIPTNEELVIAIDTMKLVQAKS